MERPTRSPSHAPDRPDAVTFPRVRTGSLTDLDREAATELAEEHLQCGPHELAWVHDQQGRYFFATRRAEDHEFYETGHELAGEPRYRWVDVGEGVSVGWLIDG